MALITFADWIDRHGDAAMERAPERPRPLTRTWLRLQLERATAISIARRPSRDRMSKPAATTVLNRRLRRA